MLARLRVKSFQGFVIGRRIVFEVEHDDARMMLGMMGFKIVINVHGELVSLDMPAQEFPDDEEW